MTPKFKTKKMKKILNVIGYISFGIINLGLTCILSVYFLMLIQRIFS